MKILEHIFQTKCHNLESLFSGITKLSTFMRRLEEQALIDPQRYDRDKYVGDGFEFFIELLLNLHPIDNRIGVYNYSPKQENDNGVDGVGVNILNEPCVVQIKYRSNTSEYLTANKDHLSNLFSDGDASHRVVIDHDNEKNYRHFIFTTAKDLHHYTDAEMFKKKVKCIGYNEIRSLIDNNIVFWNKVREVVSNITAIQKN
jgi:hypothetical protein